jgi:TIR domain
MTKPYQVFISYATEDEAYAKELSSHLKHLGLSSWFAPLSLKVGEKLLDSINAGLLASEYALLILSPPYLAKHWTSYELDILHRQHIEDQKRLFPIWHGVDKSQIHQWNPGLAGIISLKSTEEISLICGKIADVVYQSCPTRGVSPSYENPQWRFLKGCGELCANSEDGGAFNLFEAAEFPDKWFPIYVYNRPHNRKEIVLAVAKALYYRNPDVIPISKQDRNRMKELCKAFGFDLDAPQFDPAMYG